MQYFRIDPDNPDPEIIDYAAKVMRDGGIIVYPTDTLYGLGVDYFSEKALSKLYLLKQRNSKMPISMMVYSLEQIEHLFGKVSKNQLKHLQKILPGKYTILVESRIAKPVNYAAYLPQVSKSPGKVGFRIPDSPVCSALADKLAGPISTTSANISGTANVLTVQDIIAQFGDRLDIVLDIGPMQSTKGSTVIDFTKYPYLITRQGDVSVQQLKEKLPGVDICVKRDKYRVNFICTGNICRSPLAEFVLKNTIQKTKYRDIIEVSSAGTLDLPPSPAHDLSIEVADNNNLDLRSHRSRFVDRKIVDESDLIICLAKNHYDYFKINFTDALHKVILIKQWKIEASLTNPSVPDPIGHDVPFFRQTFEEVQREIKRILPFIFSDVKKFADYNDLSAD